MKNNFSRRETLIRGAVALAAPNLISTQAFASKSSVHDISIRQFKFEPSVIEVKVGDTLRWTNLDIAPHTATSEPNQWDTGEITKDNSSTVKIVEGMELEYFCAYHPHMRGEIRIISN